MFCIVLHQSDTKTHKAFMKGYAGVCSFDVELQSSLLGFKIKLLMTNYIKKLANNYKY